MRRIGGALTVFAITASLYAQGDTRINSIDEKIGSIDRQLAELMNKKDELENLRKGFIKKRELMERLKVEKIDGERPKVALVLSGGGTNGATHIGVLKMIEKYKIPLDYITGTSAGAIIGAMYSIGYSPEEIEKKINSINYDKMLTNITSNNLGEIVERSKSNKYPLSLTVDENLNIAVPAGVLTGEYIYLQLKEIFEKAEDIEEFSKLPIPFRAITTDVDTGKSVILERGDLALSTFKSMAIPTLIEPVRVDGKFYVDGGVSDNFPVQAAIDMGADIVIGVNISRDSITVDNHASIVEILTKLSTYNGVKKTVENSELADILIEPPVEVRSVDNFEDLASLVKTGEKSAEKVEHVLINLSDEEKFESLKEKRESLNSKDVEVERIKLTGNEILTMDTIMSLRPDSGIDGTLMKRETLRTWAEKIYSLSYVDRVFYDIKDGELEFIVREQVHSKLNLGIFYASDYGAGLEISSSMPLYLETDKIKSYALKGELSKYPKLSTRISSHKSWLGREVILLGELAYETDPIFIYREKDNISTYKEKRLLGAISLGTSFYDKFTLNYGFDIRNLHVTYDSGTRVDEFSELDKSESYIVNSLNLFYKYLDSEFFPTRGGKFTAQIFSENSLDSGESFGGYMIESGVYIPISEKLSIDLEIKGGEINQNEEIDFSERFMIGGLHGDFLRRSFSFAGLPYGAINTTDFFLGSGAIQYRLKPGLYLIGKYNLLTLNDDYIFDSRKKIWNDTVIGYGVGIGRDTFLGPMDIFITNNALGTKVLFQFRMGYSF